MQLTKLKMYATASIIGLAVLPKAGYIASDFYIKKYNDASTYLEEVSTTALNKIGLEPIKVSTPETINNFVLKYSTEYEINDALIRAIIKQESAGNSDSYSLAGAIGIMQIMPENTKRCGLTKISKLWDDETNIRCGTQILREEIDHFKGDVHKALQSYNGGTKNVGKLESVKQYANSVIMKYVLLTAAS